MKEKQLKLDKYYKILGIDKDSCWSKDISTGECIVGAVVQPIKDREGQPYLDRGGWTGKFRFKVISPWNYPFIDNESFIIGVRLRQIPKSQQEKIDGNRQYAA